MEQKNVLITGAARGIGKCAALLFRFPWIPVGILITAEPRVATKLQKLNTRSKP